ncbi:response regulator transcription factor [Clostridium oryzae]|uniref:Stage 0 sporulation protein A homolog n=1 Tax=Clostridium oryzae TaxID=1450648 RepID=A0A1V4IDG5_9CLOT|nr:response regulator transcription factor [Clostridium oryzae]OPJ57904.1 sensory transduction protein regX3 [Clostridium oryzae]
MNKTVNILVVEDNMDINNLLSKILSRNNYNVISAYSGSEAKLCFDKYNFELVLLDLMLPGISGEQLISIFRQTKTMPIIVISAKPDQKIKIDVLKLGADDFISKPFDPEEVLARVEAQLRRYTVFSNSNEKTNHTLKHKNLILDKHKVLVKVKDTEINLTSTEFSILELLMSYPGKVFTKSNIFQHIWQEDFIGDDKTVNVHISNLRSKISAIDPDEEYIHTVWGIGFKLSE